VDATHVAALEVVEAVFTQAPPCAPTEADCAVGAVLALAPRAFRRPLRAEERQPLLDLLAEVLAETGDAEVALRVVYQVILQDPRFLYLVETSPEPLTAAAPLPPLDGSQLASRLSYFLWGTLPDEALTQAAARGELDTADGVEAHAWRMLEDPRAEDALLDFYRGWLEWDAVLQMRISPEHYPLWTEDLRPGLLRESETFVLNVWRGDDASLRGLLLDRSVEADPTVALVYGVPEGPGQLPADQRAGLLSRSGWLMPHALNTVPSPIRRGVWVLERLLCTSLGSPPADVMLTNGLRYGTQGTNRDRFEAHTSDPACAGCHLIIDPIGFAFENYDSIGSWRDLDNGRPVDARGELLVGDLAGASFDGPIALAELLARSQTAHDCHARLWFRQGLGRSEGELDRGVLASLGEESSATGGELRQLLASLVRSEAFRSHHPVVAPVAGP
jgi:hypothetical protein